MNQFAPDAFLIGIKEGLKLSLTAFLVISYIDRERLEGLKKSLYAGILAVSAVSLGVMTVSAGAELREVSVKLIGYSFGLFYLLSLGALFHTTGTDMLGPVGRVMKNNNLVLIPVIFFLSLLYYVPDMAAASLYVGDLFFMSGQRTHIFMLAGAGMLISLTTLLMIRRTRLNAVIAPLLGLPQVLLFLALIKLMTGGVKGFAELSLIPSVQAGLAKLIHDAVHQTFVTAMVPDHQILTTTAWNFIGILFGNAVTLWLSLIILVLPLFLFIRKHFSEKAPVPPELPMGAPRRIYIKHFKDMRLLKSIPVFAFLLIITAVWFHEKGESRDALYVPQPSPVAATGGVVAIPLHSPAEDLLDGKLHTYALDVNGDAYRFLVMKRPDGTLSLCLDACEICRPEGYGQGREHLVCLYCKTPIPFETIGEPGGCNPIPVTALVTEKEIRVEVREIVKKWQLVNSAKNRENAGR